MTHKQYITVRNWDEFQHYKDRNPPWIKLHRSILDDYDFGLLSDSSKAHLVLIWILAASSDGTIPDDPKWVGRRIAATKPVDLKTLENKGFLIMEQSDSNLLADCYGNGSTSREEREKRKEEGESEREKFTQEFEDSFWKIWPERKDRKTALRKFLIVRRTVELDILIKGVNQYIKNVETKRANGFSSLNYCGASVWLNGERWNDEPDKPRKAKPYQNTPSGIDMNGITR